MATELPLESYSDGKARLVLRYVCPLCGYEGNHMAITGMNRAKPDDYELGCARCLTRWSEHRLIIVDEQDRKEMADAFREARAYRRNNKFKLQPDWELDVIALEKILLRPSEQRGN
jgi:hypothetical protein